MSSAWALTICVTCTSGHCDGCVGQTRVDSEADVGRLKKEMELYSEQAEQTRLQLGQQVSGETHPVVRGTAQP